MKKQVSIGISEECVFLVYASNHSGKTYQIPKERHILIIYICVILNTTDEMEIPFHAYNVIAFLRNFIIVLFRCSLQFGMFCTSIDAIS